MGVFSTVLSNEILDHVFGNGAYTPPTNIYVALYTVAPTIAGGGTEVDAGGYARTVNNSWSTASARNLSNSAVITFPEATADWGEIVAFGLFDAATGGNFLGFSLLDTARTVSTGDTLRFPVGDLDAGYDQ